MHLPVPPKDDAAKKLLQDLLEGSLDEPQQADPPEEEGASEPVQDPKEAQRAAERAGDGEVAGYDGPYATPEERANLGRDKTLTRDLAKTALKRGVPDSAVEDVVQETLLAASLAPKLPAGSGEPRKKYVFGVLGFKITEYWRKEYKDRELAERAEAHFAQPVRAADPVAERDLFAKLPTIVKPGQLADLRCLIRHKIGKERLTDLAREHNEDYEAFAKRIKRLGTIMTAQIAAMGGIFAILLGVALQPRPDHPLALDEPGPVALQEPAVSTHFGEPDPMDWAKVLRGEAFRACMDNRWYDCLVGLDAARDLDPSGDRDPVVAAARKDANDGYAANLKPGSPWRPPVVRAYASRASR